MIDPVTSRIWAYRGLYLLIVLVLAFGRLMPFDTSAGGLPGPDLILVVTFVWVLRRPAYVPAPLIVLACLFCDMMFAQPPGLWTLLVLLATEFLRARQGLSRELPLPLEWAFVAAVCVAVLGTQQLLLAVFALDRPPLSMIAVQAFFTVAIYPLVVLASAWVFGLRKATPGEVDALGHRL